MATVTLKCLLRKFVCMICEGLQCFARAAAIREQGACFYTPSSLHLGLVREQERMTNLRRSMQRHPYSPLNTQTFHAGTSRQSSRSDFTSTPTHHQTVSDEDLARQLQQQYDAEAGGNPRAKQPPSPIRVCFGSSILMTRLCHAPG